MAVTVVELVPIALRMLFQHPLKMLVTLLGLSVLNVLSHSQMGLLVGWCNTTSAIIRHADSDIWIMADKTTAFDYGRPIPLQRLYQTRSVPGVVWAEGMIMTYSIWQTRDGRHVNVELVGVDDSHVGGPWKMAEGEVSCVDEPHAIVIDELYCDLLGVEHLHDEGELRGTRARVKGISTEIRSFTALPFVFCSLRNARKLDGLYSEDQLTYVLVRGAEGVPIESLIQRVEASVPDVEAIPSDEFAMRTIAYWMLETGAGITVVLTAMLGGLVSAAITSQTLFALVNDNLTSFSMLIALGFSKLKLIAIVMFQGALLGIVAGTIGSVLFAVMAHASATSTIPLETTPSVFTALFLTNVLVSTLSSVVAIRSILSVDPVSIFGA